MTKPTDLVRKQEEMRLRKRDESPEMKLASLPKFMDWLKQMQSQGVGLTCRCDRPLVIHKVHCPNCASTNCYALQAVEGMLSTGESIQARRHRCRRCGLYFTDLEMFLHCEAAPPQPSMQEIRKTAKANDSIKKAGFADVDDFKRKLLEYREQQEADKKKVQ